MNDLLEKMQLIEINYYELLKSSFKVISRHNSNNIIPLFVAEGQLAENYFSNLIKSLQKLAASIGSVLATDDVEDINDIKALVSNYIDSMNRYRKESHKQILSLMKDGRDND